LRLLPVLGAVTAVVVVSSVYFEIAAQQEAQAFCTRAQVGAPASPIALDAASIGERMLRRITPDRIQVGFTGIPPFSRHLCTIDVQDGRVKGARISRLD